MIDWIDQRCRSWGNQMRHIYMGKDGYPSRTILHKMIVEGVLGAASERFTQHYPECLAPAEIQLNNAVKTLGERDRELLAVKYIFREKPKNIMRLYRLERTAYYDWFDNVHEALTKSLNSLGEQNSQICRRIPTLDFDSFRTA